MTSDNFEQALRAAFVDQVTATEHWIVDTMILPKDQYQIRQANLAKGIWTQRNLTTVKITDMTEAQLIAIIRNFGEVREIINEIARRPSIW